MIVAALIVAAFLAIGWLVADALDDRDEWL